VVAAVWLTARAEWRQRWPSIVLLTVLAGLAGGVALVALTGSRRTDTAFARLEEHLKTPNLRVTTDARPSPELIREAARLPGVEAARQQVLLAVAPAGSGLVPLGDTIGVAEPVVAGDDRIDALMVEGRRADQSRADELVVNEAMRDALHAEIGDRFSLVSLTPEQAQAAEADGHLPSPAGPTQEVTLVGVARAAEDVSDAPEPLAYVTTAYYERHGRAIFRSEGVGLRVDEDHRPGIEDRVRSVFGEDAEIEAPDDLASRIEDGLAVEVNGLRAFSLAAVVAGLVALGQALARQAGIMAEQHPTRRAMGMTSRQLIASAVTVALPVAAGGALLAVAGAVAGGPLTISGLARQAEPDPGPWFDAAILVPGAIVDALVVVTLAAATAALAGARRPADQRVARARRPRGAGFAAGFPPPVAIGGRMALETRRGPTALPSRAALVGVTVGVAGVVATLVVGARIDHLLASPNLWGANYDAVVTTVGDLSSFEPTAQRIARDPDVEAVALFDSLDLVVHAAGRQSQVEAVTVWAKRGAIPPVLAQGRAPAAPDEVALGAEVLDRLGLDVGDTVEVGRGGEELTFRVVGRHLQPSEDDPNSGMLLAPQGFEALAGDEGDHGVLVRFAPDVDTRAALARLRGLGDEVDVTGATDDAPSNVDNLDELGALPAVLASFLALLAVIAVVHALVSTPRRRRHELAVLRVLGFVGSQMRSTLRWQALTVVAVGLLVGVPSGIIAARRIWSALAGAIGVVDDWTVPWLAVVIAVPVALCVAVLLAILPGRAAARVPPGRVLRTR
jgi:ABC-type lipoprotein release transport system permease subunit